MENSCYMQKEEEEEENYERICGFISTLENILLLILIFIQMYRYRRLKWMFVIP